MKRLHKILAITVTAAMTTAALLPVWASDQAVQPDITDAEFTETDYEAMTALGETVTVRTGPGFSYTEVCILSDGELVNVSREWFDPEEQITWCYITCGDISGWVPLSVLDTEFPEDGYHYPPVVEYDIEYYEAAPSAADGKMAVYEALEETGVMDNGLAMSDAYLDPEPESFYWDPEPSLDGEKYAEYDETGFRLVQAAPLSTFSADVDTASYANIRRMIMDGYEAAQIPEDAVRAEEFVNYFSYGLSEPEVGEMFSVYVETSVCPWNEGHDLMMIGIRAKEEEVESIRQNLVFLIDISGSMDSSDKLPLAKKSIIRLLDTLSPEDTVSIVTYASGEDLVLSGVHPTERMLGHIKAKINQLYADGSTAGEKGLQMAYEVAKDNYIEGGNNRIILMTDGDLNVGISDPDELEKFITEKAKSGVYLSALGFGKGNRVIFTFKVCTTGAAADADSHCSRDRIKARIPLQPETDTVCFAERCRAVLKCEGVSNNGFAVVFSVGKPTPAPSGLTVDSICHDHYGLILIIRNVIYVDNSSIKSKAGHSIKIVFAPYFKAFKLYFFVASVE